MHDRLRFRGILGAGLYCDPGGQRGPGTGRRLVWSAAFEQGNPLNG